MRGSSLVLCAVLLPAELAVVRSVHCCRVEVSRRLVYGWSSLFGRRINHRGCFNIIYKPRRKLLLREYPCIGKRMCLSQPSASRLGTGYISTAMQIVTQISSCPGSAGVGAPCVVGDGFHADDVLPRCKQERNPRHVCEKLL